MWDVGDDVIKVMCVDDEVHVLNALKRTIRHKNIELHLTSNIEEAFFLFNLIEPDVVITDYRMPELNGKQLITELQKQNLDTSWIILSGYAQGEDTNKLIDTGQIEAFISKPWKSEELIEEIFKAYSKRKGK